MNINDFLTELQQIDYISIIRSLTPIVTYYTCDRVIKEINLHKDFKPKNINKVILPPDLTQEYSNIDIENLIANCFKENVLEFAKVIIENFSQKDLTIFYNNINTLKIQFENFKLKRFVLGNNNRAEYNIPKNEIYVDKEDYTTTIYHELFHMASSVYKNGILYSGFSQETDKSDGVNLGDGLNEGYTQLLTQRYFGYIDNLNKSYIVEVHYAELLEKIVGQEKMKSLYLNADLSGLINELKIYSSEEEIGKFFSSLDFINNHINRKKISHTEKNMITSSLKSASEFLLEAYNVKLKRKLNDKTIDENEFVNEICVYFQHLGNEIKGKKYSFKYFTAQELKEILSKILNDFNLNVSINSEEGVILKNK